MVLFVLMSLYKLSCTALALLEVAFLTLVIYHTAATKIKFVLLPLYVFITCSLIEQLHQQPKSTKHYHAFVMCSYRSFNTTEVDPKCCLAKHRSKSISWGGKTKYLVHK